MSNNSVKPYFKFLKLILVQSYRIQDSSQNTLFIRSWNSHILILTLSIFKPEQLNSRDKLVSDSVRSSLRSSPFPVKHNPIMHYYQANESA